MAMSARMAATLAGAALSAALAGEAAAQSGKCPVTEAQLLGPWKVATGGFFQEMEFERDGTNRVFNSWLHHRPEVSGGRWRIENCTLYIEHPNPDGFRFELRLVRIRGDRLYLREPDAKTDQVYKRIKVSP